MNDTQVVEPFVNNHVASKLGHPSMNTNPVLKFVTEVALAALSVPKEWRVKFMMRKQKEFLGDALKAGMPVNRAEKFSDKLAQLIWDEIRNIEQHNDTSRQSSETSGSGKVS